MKKSKRRALIFSLFSVFILTAPLVSCGTSTNNISGAEIVNGELIITYEDGTSSNLGKVVGKDGVDGKDGIDGSQGIDGKTPEIRINYTTNYWEVSYDGGKTWKSLGVKASSGEGGSFGGSSMITVVGSVEKVEPISPYGDPQFVHPSVIRVLGKFNGYEYWMAITPYVDSNNATENPCIYASHNGKDWVVPTGITNPLFGPPEVGFYADVNLVYDSGLYGDGIQKLYLYWSNPHKAEKYVSHTLDGVTWTEPETLEYYISDTYIVKDGDIFKGFGKLDSPLEGSFLTQNFSSTYNGFKRSRMFIDTNLKGNHHHPMVMLEGGGFHFTVSIKDQLYYGFSPDGGSTLFDPIPVLKPNSSLPWPNVSSIYTGCLVQSPEPEIYYLYFSVIETVEGGRPKWWVGRVPCKINLSQVYANPHLKQKTNVPLFLEYPIRDSESHKPDLLTFGSWEIPAFNKYKYKTLRISNTHDVPLNIRFMSRFGAANGNILTIGEKEQVYTIPANSDSIVTEKDLEILGIICGDNIALTVRYTGAIPTSGHLTMSITMYN